MKAMSAQEIKISLPDGAIKTFPAGVTPHQIAESISPRLAQAAVVARVTAANAAPAASSTTEGKHASEAAMYSAADPANDPSAPRLVDLSQPLTQDAHVALLTDRDPDALQVLRHSAAHLMATAVLELFPETKLGHGPATDQGFFYDFYRPTPFTPEDLKLIEARMADIVARDEKFVREFEPREKALIEFRSHNDFMKVHFVERFTQPGESVSLYRNGNFVDFCRGPHVPSTSRIKAFRLTNLAGDYWLGDEKNPQLQRL